MRIVGYLIALLLSGPLVPAANVSAMASDSTAAQSSLAERGLALLDALDAGDEVAVVAGFSASLPQQPTPGMLLEPWRQLKHQFGGTPRRGAAQEQQRGALSLVTVPLHYPQGSMEALVAFDASNDIVGFRLLPHTPQAPPVAADAAFHERDFAVAGGQLPGTLTLPHGSGPFPAVLLVHGSGPNDRDQALGPNRPFRDLAHGLAERGLAVLRYEKRTRARPQDFAGNAFTVEQEVVADAVAALEELRADPSVDAGQVHLLGHSLGAMLAPRIAERTHVAGMVLLAAPARPLEDLVVEQMTYILGLEPANPAANAVQLAEFARQRDVVKALDDPTATGLMLGLPATYWLDLSGYDPVAAAAELDTPLLLIHGGRDYQVTDTDFGLWRAGLGDCRQATLERFDDLNHLMMTGEGTATPAEYLRPGVVDPHVVTRIADWIHARAARPGDDH